MLTFWSQPNPYTEYVRCSLPARQLGGQVRNIDAVRALTLNPVEVNEGPAVWQLLVNGARLAVAVDMMKAGIECFLEVDDDYTEWDPRYANPDWIRGMPDDPRVASVALHRRIAGLVAGVIVATPRLAERYGELSDNVHVCPNSVDPSDWPELPPRGEAFRIVWMASASHRVDQHLILPALELAADLPGVEVHVFGARMQSEKLIPMPWVRDPQEYRDKLVELRPDLGVCPVSVNEFSRGKSDLKALEYAMAGALPVVPAFEPYEPWLGLDGCHLTANTADEWVEVVGWACRNRDAVRLMAANARDHVLTERTIEGCADRWLEATGITVQA